ncbi:hypothetical protein Tco_1407202 [Tanacetum coccineum]
MSTQQDIYAAGSENRPPMLNKENYVPWSSRLLRYAKSRPNGKLIYNSIMNGPYVRRMIPEPGSDDWIQEKKAKFVMNGKVIHPLWGIDRVLLSPFSKLMNDFKRNKHFPEKIASNLKFLNNLQPMESACYYCSSNEGLAYDIYTQFIAQPGIIIESRQTDGVWLEQWGNQLNSVSEYCNQNGQIGVQILGIGMLFAARLRSDQGKDAAYLQTQLLIAQKEEAGIQLQAEEFDLMAAAADLDEIEEVNANCILMANLQQASTSGTQTDNAPVYDSDGSAEVHNYDNCYDNEIFNMFTQEEQYTELLEPIPEPHHVQQNDSNVISDISSVEQEGGTVDQHPATVEETRAYFESLYNNLALEVEKVNSVNRKMKETNADLTTELARYKNQEKCFEISQEKYDKLERCYQKSVYQEQCLTKKINALHLSSVTQITTLNEEIANLNNQLSKEKSTVSSHLEEKKKLKSEFQKFAKTSSDKQIQLENKIKELIIFW